MCLHPDQNGVRGRLSERTAQRSAFLLMALRLPCTLTFLSPCRARVHRVVRVTDLKASMDLHINTCSLVETD